MKLDAEILLVGAGPIGLEVAVALKKAGLDYLHLESGSIASTIAWWAPGTSIFSSPERISIAGVPFETYPHSKATREEYLAYLRLIVKQFELAINLYTRVDGIKKNQDGSFTVNTSRSFCGEGGEEYQQFKLSKLSDSKSLREIKVRKVILAIGDMQLPNYLGVEGERLDHVTHYLGDPHKYSGSSVLIVGGKNSAAEAVVRLARVAAKVSWCIRSADLDKKIKPWILPEALGLIREGKVNLLVNSSLQSIEYGRALIKDNLKNQIQEIFSDFVLLLTGYRQDSSLFNQLGINLIGDSLRPEVNLETMETNVAGVFVAGTAIAGTQLGGAKIFIENCHQHSYKIATALGAKILPFASGVERNIEEREQ